MRITVVTTEVLGERMAGPAIRAWHVARELAAHHDVWLVTTESGHVASEGFAVGSVGDQPAADVWVVPPRVLLDHPEVEASDAVVVVDLYDPIHLENLEKTRQLPAAEQRGRVHNAQVTLNRALLRGDAFLTAGARQRDLWLGALGAVGRLNPVSYPSIAGLLLEAPFGTDPEPPAPAAGPALRDLPGIGPDDVVLLWGGGLYEWFDPESLVRAVDVLRRSYPGLRLVFLGVRHPNPAQPQMPVVARTRALVAELGLDDHVLLHDGWVPYAERGGWLLQADVGVSTHHDHLETAFSFRTRILDYLWAGLPVVATAGDAFAGPLTRSGAGTVVPAGDVAALVAALDPYVADAGRRAVAGAAARELAAEYAWPRALAPLVAFCAAPRRAPDLLDPATAALLRTPFDVVGLEPRGALALARRYLAEGGVRLVVRRIASRARRLAVRG